MQNINKKAFTLIELVVAATILVILTTVGFYSYTKNISDARDGVRKTDIATLSSQLNLYKKKRGAYPLPGDYFSLLNRGNPVAIQGLMNKKVTLTTADKLPLDPELNIPYFYSVTKNKQEFQIALSLENSDDPYALLEGSYRSIAKNILPGIVLAAKSSSDLEINDAVSPGDTNRDFFIFNNGYSNLPYDFESGNPFHESSKVFADLLSDAGETYWQNSDYRTCSEILSAGKGINISGGTDEYQILNISGVLTNTGCTTP